MALQEPRSGLIEFDGTELTTADPQTLRRLRSRFQMVFQDPVSALNPRRTVHSLVTEPLRVWAREGRADRDGKVSEMLKSVGLDAAAVGNRRPYEFSGGQAQRISIARSLILEPDLLVCDEPVSSLDVSVQAQILNLLQDMKARYGLTMIFISHDLAVVKNVSDRLAVMYLGKLCEIGDADAVYGAPAHPYTNALLASVPRLGEVREVPPLAGELPSATNPPSGCRFRTRCQRASGLCAEVEPEMHAVGDAHHVACHHPIGPASQPASPASTRPAESPDGIRSTRDNEIATE
jgi:peptide/nickel transport system ATP-binding protein